MSALHPSIDRQAFIRTYFAGRERSAFLFDLLAPGAYETAPVPLRHPFVFYEGHIPAFSFITLVRSALGGASVDEDLERLFRRGIDPDNVDEAHHAAPAAWPSRAQVRAFGDACDRRVEHALRYADIDDAQNPYLTNAQAVHVCLEHELMHHETLLYILHQLDLTHKHTLSFTHEDHSHHPSRRIRIPAGETTLGANPAEAAFGWDNEFGEVRVAVNAFGIERDNVTNGQYSAFLNAGGAAPPFWRKRDGAWHLLTQFSLIPLPLSWPVYVTQNQACAYAAWKGMRLPTEAEYHRAAFGTPEGRETLYPWGDAPPDETHGNFGAQRYDPVPVGSYPKGASAWGVRDLIGNGWEWTMTPFTPFPGFTPMATYPVYSADFFDGKHYVLKGASPVTDRRLVRRTFRNWFRADYPYVYATFRCVE